MTETHRGSCHCGRIAFEAEIDLAAGTGRCNCSYCRKTRNWVAIVPPGAFRIVRGDQHLVLYAFHDDGPVRHGFCGRCGVRIFSRGSVEALGGAFVSVSIPALDAPDDEIAAAPVLWADGLRDDWSRPPSSVAHL